MPTLREREWELRAALLGGDESRAPAAVAPDGFAPEARLAIYRHHVLSSLTAVLVDTFPVVRRLVDPRFFAYAADVFIRRHPPSGPCLFEYGAGFADFLADFPPCRDLPYLADVARLEWALEAAYHDGDAAPRHLQSPYPIDTIWHANQPGADPNTVVHLDAGPVRLEIRRLADDVIFTRTGGTPSC